MFSYKLINVFPTETDIKNLNLRTFLFFGGGTTAIELKDWSKIWEKRKDWSKIWEKGKDWRKIWDLSTKEFPIHKVPVLKNINVSEKKKKYETEDIYLEK